MSYYIVPFDKETLNNKRVLLLFLMTD